MNQSPRLAELFIAATAPREEERASAMAAAQREGMAEDLERLLAADRKNHDGFLSGSMIGTGGDGPARVALAPGAELGGGRVVGVLSRGASATVYLAEQGVTKRRVAIKVLHAESTGEVLVRFEQERRIVAMLRHENIATLHDAGVTPDGHAYFVMEYVDGLAITEYAGRAGLPMRERLGLFLQLCEGVAHAHLHGVIHRDLKPSNILVTDAGGRRVVKVIDFGIAKPVWADSRTQQGQVLGTLGYMAPEQLDGDGGIADTRSDGYSLGAVLFELATGSPAFAVGDEGPLTRVARVASREGLAERTAGRLRGDLGRIVARAMQRDVARRYQTVQSLRADVESFLDGRAVSVRAADPIYVVGRLIRRHRAWSVAAVVLLILAVGAVVRWQRAERAKFDLAVSVLQSWFNHSQALARTLGERARREPLLVMLEEQSRELLGQAPNNEGVMSLRADIAGECADYELERGNIAEAARRFDEAYGLRTRLWRSGDVDRRADLSVATVWLGDAASAAGDSAGARQRYAEALRLDEGLAADFPRSSRALTLLGWSLDRVGMGGLSGDATAYFERCVRTFEALNEVEQSADASRGLSTAYLHLAFQKWDRGEAAAAADCFDRSIVCADRAVELGPDDRLALWQSVRVRQGRAEFASGRGPGLPGELAPVIDMAERLVERDPEELVLRDALAEALMQAALSAERAGVAETARGLYERELVHRKFTLARLPLNAAVRECAARTEAALDRVGSR